MKYHSAIRGTDCCYRPTQVALADRRLWRGHQGQVPLQEAVGWGSQLVLMELSAGFKVVETEYDRT